MMGLKERKHRERSERKEQILNAARRLLLQKGLNGTSINQIAKTAELGVGTIYFYFQSKEDVFAALQEEGLEILQGKIQQAFRTKKNPENRLREIAGAYLTFSETSKNYFDVINYFLFSADSMFAPNLKDRVDQHGNKVLSYVQRTIEDGAKEGIFKRVDSRRYAVTLWAMLHGLIQFKKLKNTILQGENHKQLVEYAINQFVENLKLSQP